MSFRARQNYGQVQFIVDGKLVAEVSPGKAREVGRAILQVAGLAAEWANAEEVARDNAILIRAGFPVGLANHQAVLNESVKMAVSDRDLRRAMPGGVRSEAVCGTPMIKRYPKRSNHERP